MKVKYYSKNHFFIVFIILVGLVYSIFLYYQYREAVKENLVFNKTVIKQNCNAAPRIKSTVWIIERNKTYSIDIPYENCINYPVNSKIKVLYNKKQDTYLYPVNMDKYLNRIIFLCAVFLFSVLPWSYLLKTKNR